MRQIFSFISQMNSYNDDTFFQCLIINSDQNSTGFYDKLKEVISNDKSKKDNNEDRKNPDNAQNRRDNEEKLFEHNVIFSSFDQNCKKESRILGESSFKDLGALIDSLSLTADNQITTNFKSLFKQNYKANPSKNNNLLVHKERMENPEDKIIRIIVIKEIARINTIDLNAFISKLIDYNKAIKEGGVSYINNRENKYFSATFGNFRDEHRSKYYSNIVIFDVCHDPNSLFNKLYPNILAKMVFNNIEYTASKYTYKEILYHFINGQNNIFLPFRENMAKLLYYIDTYQITLNGFKQYFKFLIFEFFLLQNWDEEKFVIFDKQIHQRLFENNNKDVVVGSDDKSIISEKSNDDYQKEHNSIEEVINELLQHLIDPGNYKQELVEKEIKKYSKEYTYLHEDFYYNKLIYGLFTEAFTEIIDTKYKLEAYCSHVGINMTSLFSNHNSETVNNYNKLKTNSNEIYTISSTLRYIMLNEIKAKTNDLDCKKKFSKEEFFFNFMCLGFDKDSAKDKRVRILLELLVDNNTNYDFTKDVASECIEESFCFVLNIYEPIMRHYIDELKSENLKKELILSLDLLIDKIKDDEHDLKGTTLDRFSKIKNNEVSTNGVSSNANAINFNISIKNNMEIFQEYVHHLRDFLRNKKLFNWIYLYKKLNKCEDDITGKIKDSDVFYEYLDNKYLVYENMTNPAFDYLIIKDLTRLTLMTGDEEDINKRLDFGIETQEVKKTTDTKLVINKKEIKSKMNNIKMEVEEHVDEKENQFADDLNGNKVIKVLSDDIEKINKKKIYKAFLEAYSILGTEFKLKYFYAEFLMNLGLNLKKDKSVCEGFLPVFLKISHEFYILGLFHKKYIKNNEVFVKNYYENAGYFD